MPTDTSTKKACVGLLFAMVLTIVLYWPGLSGPMLLDDAGSLPSIEAWLNGATTWQHMLFGGSAGTFGRPLAMASLALDAWLRGYSPYSFKLGSLLIHLLCSAAVQAFVGRLARRDAVLAPHAPLFALGVATVWLLHPFNASTVLYSVQRMAQISALMVLLGLWLYLVLRSRLEARPSTGALIGLFVGIPALTALGFFGKESALLLPALCLVLELTCFHRASRSRAVTWFFALFCVLPICSGLAYLVARPTYSFSVYAARDFGLWERLLSQARALCDYLWKIVAPNPPQMGVYFDDFAISTSLVTPITTLPAILLLLGISLLAWRLRQKVPSLTIGWSLFLVGHAMESTILPLELYFEHRNYLPMVGILYALGGLVVIAGNRLTAMGLRSGRIGLVAAAGTLMVLSMGTHGRARVWSTSQSIALGATAARPESFRANMMLVQEALKVDDRATVEQALERLSNAASARTRAYALLNRVNIDCILDGKGDPHDLQQAAAVFPPRLTQSDWDIFGILYRNPSNCEGIDDLTLANALDAIVDKGAAQPDSIRYKFQLRHVVARVYARAGDWPKALEQAKLAWQPGTEAAAAELLIRAQLALGDLDGAEKIWAEAQQRANPLSNYDTDGIQWLRKQIDAAKRPGPGAAEAAAAPAPGAVP
jgi:hypothetical protein